MKHRLKINPVAQYYWKKARKHPLYLTGVLICLPISVLFSNYLPALVLANVLGRLSSGDYVSGAVLQSFGPDLLLYLAVIFGGVFMWRMLDFIGWRLEWSVEQDIAEEVFDNLVSKSANFHANNFGGALVSGTNKLLSGYIRVADTTIYQTYSLISSIIIICIIIGFRFPLFIAVLLFVSFLFVGSAVMISKPVRKLSARFAEAESEQTGYLADAITNILAIKSFARGNYERKRFHTATSKTRRRLMDFAHLNNIQMTILATFSRTMAWLALALAIVGVLVFDADIAIVFLIFTYTASVVDQLFTFSNNSLRNYNRAFGDAAYMVRVLGEPPEVLDPVKPETLRITTGDIEFKNVDFTHDGSEDSLFKGLSLKIKHGEKIGLVGHSGSGKTTFTRVLLRFSDIDKGAIEISGQNIANITQDDLHKNIAYVPQEPLLFHRTIAENIGYGKPKAGHASIEKAAKMSHAAEFVEALPDGYDTLVGERGVKLSGGQRQRVAIARAMLKDAPILVLDEATSALDSESEVLIQDALWKLMEGRTAIVIAHRLSTIQKMDRIIVLDEGKIIEEGSHKDLIRKGGKYADLWKHQSGGFIEE